MARKALPAQDVLLQLLNYDPETGALTWRERPDHPAFTTRWAGKPAFTALERGYKQGRIFMELHYAHRIIWRMVTGEIAHDVDHINGVRSDNRWSNLRSVSRAENLRNRRLSCQNTSGTHGVYARSWGWQAYIRADGKTKCLGSFKTKEEAVEARRAANEKYGYHQNHGVRAA
jgi:hypothetical protein